MGLPQTVSLVILAAGLGSRFGGNKQLASIGDRGRPLMYFSVMDAYHAGVRELVLIVNKLIAPVLQQEFLPLLPADMQVALILQNLDDLPDAGGSCPARRKPWGTGHALWCARKVLTQSFVVINADDYYGPSAMPTLVEHLQSPHSDWAMVSYPLANTLSEYGSVNRGLCRIHGQRLQRIEECMDIAYREGGLIGRLGDTDIELPPEQDVSMNIWGFTPAIFTVLEQGFSRFLQTAELEKDEYYLPEAVADCIARQVAQVRVYRSPDCWLGITYPQDLELVSEYLQQHPASTPGPSAL